MDELLKPSIPDAFEGLCIEVERSGIGEDEAASLMRIADAMVRSDGNSLGFVNSMHALLRKSVGRPAVMASALGLAAAVASELSGGWDPVDERVSPFSNAEYRVPVVGRVGDDGVVWSEKYRDKVLKGARQVFPGDGATT